MDLPSAIGQALLALFLSFPAVAHNGAVGVAPPVQGIVIDGDLSDWPLAARWYPIATLGVGESPVSAQDFSGRFTAGYNAAENALYVAVDVADESTVVDSSSAAREQLWNGQDGCEIYVDIQHAREESPAIQYWLYGHTQAARLSDGGVFPRWKNSIVEASRTRGRHVYEWKIDIGAISDQRIAAGSHMTVGFDVAVIDRDEDGSFSWLAWGGGVIKIRSADRRGDLVLVGPDSSLGELEVRLERERTREGEKYKQVHIQSLDFPALWVVGETDRDGRVSVSLPAGVYRSEVEWGGRGEQEKRQGQDVVIESGGKRELVLSSPRPQGTTVLVEQGRTMPAGTGIRSDKWHSLGTADGLPGSSVFSLFQDSRGYLWLGTNAGVCRYDGTSFSTFSSGEARPDLVFGVLGITEDSKGHVWFGLLAEGVFRYDGKQLTHFTERDGLADNQVTSLMTDRRGNVWIGTQGGGVSRYDGEYFTSLTARDGLANNSVWSIAEDGGGDIWFGTLGGGASRYDGRNFTTFTTTRGLVHNSVNKVYVDRDGNIWFGTNGGVSRYDGKEFTNLTIADGLADNAVRGIAEDEEGTIWFGTEGGLSRYDGHELATVAC
jgi:sugar lactone lactonase YvrE